MKQLKDALHVAETFLLEYQGTDRLEQHWTLYEELVSKTYSDVAYDSECNELARYTSIDVASFLEGRRDGTNKTGIAPQRVKRLFDKLSLRIGERECRLKELAEELGCSFFPKLGRQKGGGANNPSLYWIEACELNLDASDTEKLKDHDSAPSAASYSPQAEIEYYLDARPKLPFWSNFLISIKFGDRSWERWLMALTVSSPFFCLAVLVIVTLLIINGTITEINSKLYTLLLMYPFIYFFGFSFLIKALNNSIALLPHWMLPWRLDSAVLQLTIDGSPDRNYRIKELGIKVYAAKCPACNHRVDLKSGGIRHWGRIIGVCDHNPIEHRYSFDFTNLTGNKLL